MKSEAQTLEVKAASEGCPSRLYSYEAFRKKYQDDIRVCERADESALDLLLLEEYLLKIKKERPNLAQLSNERIFELPQCSQK